MPRDISLLDLVRYTGRDCPFWFTCPDYRRGCSMYDCPRPPSRFMVMYWRMLKGGKDGTSKVVATR